MVLSYDLISEIFLKKKNSSNSSQFNVNKVCFPMIKWRFFQTSDDISRYKNCYLTNALRPTSFSYLDLYCELASTIYMASGIEE